MPNTEEPTCVPLLGPARRRWEMAELAFRAWPATTPPMPITPCNWWWRPLARSRCRIAPPCRPANGGTAGGPRPAEARPSPSRVASTTTPCAKASTASCASGLSMSQARSGTARCRQATRCPRARWGVASPATWPSWEPFTGMKGPMSTRWVVGKSGADCRYFASTAVYSSIHAANDHLKPARAAVDIFINGKRQSRHLTSAQRGIAARLHGTKPDAICRAAVAKQLQL